MLGGMSIGTNQGFTVSVDNIRMVLDVPDPNRGGRRQVTAPLHLFMDVVAVCMSDYLPEMGDEIARALENRIKEME